MWEESEKVRDQFPSLIGAEKGERGVVFGGRRRLGRRSSSSDELLRTWDTEEVIGLLLSEGRTGPAPQRFCSCVSNMLCLVTSQISN